MVDLTVLTSPRRALVLGLSLCAATLACSDDTTADTSTSDTDTGTGTGDPPGDGDPGDGDPSTGDGDPSTGDGDGDPGCPIGAEGCPCTPGGSCDAGLMCDGGVCVPASGDGDGDPGGCVDDSDCGFLDGPCGLGDCVDGACEVAAMNNGEACDNGEVCMDAGECQNGACVETPKDCSTFNIGCIVGYCDPMTDACDVMLAADDTPCAGVQGCSSAPVCTMGLCEDPTGQPLFYEDFSDNSAGWTLDTNWEIGPAVGGCGDPDLDNSPGDDNGVAGVVLGGCAPTQVHPYYCLTSPVVDTAGLREVWLTFYRSLWSDYTPYMKNVIEVWDGADWQLIFETLGEPEVDDNGWQYFGYDVSAHANAGMQVRWCYNIDDPGVYERGSWTLDDVTISASECNGADDL